MVSYFKKTASRNIAIGGLLLATLLMGLWLGQQTRQFAHYPPDFDEAVHLLPVVQVAHALQQGDWAGFWQATNEQDQLAAYPFVHSWLAAPIWLLRPGLVAQRWFSLLCVMGSVMLAGGIGYQVAKQQRELALLVSGGLVLTSFPLWVYGSLAYLEGVGLLLTLLAIYCYLRAPAATEANGSGWLLAASLVTAVTFLTKYNFGIFIMGAIGLNELISWLLTQPRHSPPWERWLRLGLPALPILLLWFAHSGRLDRFLYFSQAQEGQLGIWQMASWVYYPHSLYAHYMPGMAALLLVGGGVLWAIGQWQNGRFRFLLLYLVVSWLLLLIVPQKVPRFLYTVAPVALLLAGPFTAWLYGYIAAQRQRIGWAGLAIAAGWLIWWGTAVTHQFSYLQANLDVAFDSVPTTTTGYDWISQQTLAAGHSVYLLNGWHLFNPYSLQWHHLASQGYTVASPLDWTQAQSGLAPEPTPANLAHLRQQWQADGIDYLLTIDGSPAGAHTGWAIAEPLLTQGYLQPVASSGPITLRNWDAAYRERVLAANFTSPAEWLVWQQAHHNRYEIRLHLYRLSEPD